MLVGAIAGCLLSPVYHGGADGGSSGSPPGGRLTPLFSNACTSRPARRNGRCRCARGRRPCTLARRPAFPMEPVSARREPTSSRQSSAISRWRRPVASDTRRHGTSSSPASGRACTRRRVPSPATRAASSPTAGRGAVRAWRLRDRPALVAGLLPRPEPARDLAPIRRWCSGRLTGPERPHASTSSTRSIPRTRHARRQGHRGGRTVTPAISSAGLRQCHAVRARKRHRRARCPRPAAPAPVLRRGLTLAQIGRLTRESEATVSRKLERARRELRRLVAQALRNEHGLAATAIAECFEAAADAPELQLTRLLTRAEDG